MVSNFALLSNLLLAAAALAVPSSSPVVAPLTPSPETRQSSSPNQNLAEYWTGASFTSKPNGTFACVCGSFPAPDPTPDNLNGTLNVWVAIDGATCSSRASSLRAGVKTTFVNGQPEHRGWASWNNNDPYYFNHLIIGSSDVVTATVILTSANSGTVFVKNESTGQLAWKIFTVDSINELCGSDAEWVISDADGTMPNIGSVILDRAYASGPTGGSYVYTPYSPQDGAALRNMTQNGAVVMVTLVADDKESLGFIQSALLDAVTGG